MKGIAGRVGRGGRGRFFWLVLNFAVLGASPWGLRSNHVRRNRAHNASATALILTACFAHTTAAQAANIQVTTTQPGVTSGLCSLQEAIYSSELKLNIAIDVPPNHFYTTGCVPGTGDDTIELAPAGAVFNFENPWPDPHNIYGPTATPVIFSTIKIEGNGATLQWASQFTPFIGNSRLFAVGRLNDPGGFVGTGNSDSQKRLRERLPRQGRGWR